MTAALETFLWLTLASDPDTPPEFLPDVGKVVGLPPEYRAKLGSGPSEPGFLFANTARPIRGYLRTGGPTGYEWVIIGSITPAIRNAVETIPPLPRWVNTAGGGPRSIYRQAARQLVLADVPGPDVVDLLTRLYNAAVQNYIDQHPEVTP